MSGEIVGEIAQGALIARAAEPEHGETDAGHTHEAACLNCATPLIGNHCHACGQAAHVHRTLGAFFHDLLHGVFHFEGKIWRTLPMLAWNPGKLTREYIDGRRASYISPIALFLFVMFLTFAVFNAIGDPVRWNVTNQSVEKVGLEQAKAEARSEIARLEREQADARRQGREVPGIEGRIEGARGELQGIEAVERGDWPDSIATADSPEDEAIVARINAVLAKVRSNPPLAMLKLQSNAYKYSWLLIPISVPFIWLLFPFSRQFHLYDHTVFVTYSLCFTMLLLTVSALTVNNPGIAWIGVLAMMLVPPHLYRQLRGTYALSRRGALLRLPLVLLFATTASLLWSLALLALVIAE